MMLLYNITRNCVKRFYKEKLDNTKIAQLAEKVRISSFYIIVDDWIDDSCYRS